MAEKKMKPEIKKLWVDALRSGEYKQAREVLRTNGGTSFCCLGVLTDLYCKSNNKAWYDAMQALRRG